jgi:hypothetical protein
MRHALPGEHYLDQELLERSITRVNAVTQDRNGMDATVALAQAILDLLFDGRMPVFRETEKDHVTFRVMINDPRLEPSYNAIWYAMATLEQLFELPAEVAQALPVTHHRLLISVRDRATKVRLARRAVERGLSSRELASEVRRYRADSGRAGRTGRPPLPAWVKGVKRVSKAVTLARSEEISPDSLRHFKPEEARRVVADLDKQLQHLQLLREQIVATVECVEGVNLHAAVAK